MTVPELKELMKQAMRDKDSVALTTIRNVLASCQNECISLGRGPQGELSSDEVIALLRREVKRLKDSIQQFSDGGREDLAEDSKAELAVLEKFLPSLMSREQIIPLVQAKITELGITDKSQSGKLVGVMMKELAGQADGADVKAVIEDLLS